MKNMWVIMEYNKIEMKDAFLFRATSCTGNLRYWKLLVMPKLCEKPVGTAPVSEKKKRDLGCVFGGDLLTVGQFASMYGIYSPLKM